MALAMLSLIMKETEAVTTIWVDTLSDRWRCTKKICFRTPTRRPDPVSCHFFLLGASS
uniref:Uncharacterized protein n=1 Tax=Anguilla anguilla TaxID=7936 RepID=A0A0E9PVN0_ANGAN